MAKPTENLDWATNGGVTDILEPTAGQRASGILEGDTWARRRLNWMFYGLGKWIVYLRNNVLELGTGDDQARNNLENDVRFVQHTEVVDDLVSSDIIFPLSANQGRLLKDQADTALVEGVGDSQGRTNTQNDARFVQGQSGTGASEVQTNSENDARFVQHTEVVNTLGSNSTTQPLSANQGRNLNNLKVDRAANLTDLNSRTAARNTLGFRHGVVSLGTNQSADIELGLPVLSATVSIKLDNADGVNDGPHVWWDTGSSVLTVWNASDSSTTLDFSWIAIVQLPD